MAGIELALTSLQVLHCSVPSPRSDPAVISHPGCADPSLLPLTGWSRGPVAVENGCHNNGAKLYPFALGEIVPCPPPAGPQHADEGQHLRPRQLGVSAGDRHLPQLLRPCNDMLHFACLILGPLWIIV